MVKCEGGVPCVSQNWQKKNNNNNNKNKKKNFFWQLAQSDKNNKDSDVIGIFNKRCYFSCFMV